jgi:hypothetical protein
MFDSEGLFEGKAPSGGTDSRANAAAYFIIRRGLYLALIVAPPEVRDRPYVTILKSVPATLVIPNLP